MLNNFTIIYSENSVRKERIIQAMIPSDAQITFWFLYAVKEREQHAGNKVEVLDILDGDGKTIRRKRKQ